MDFYIKAEPAGEFASGVFNIKEHKPEEVTMSDIAYEWIYDEKFHPVHTNGIPLYMSDDRDMEDMVEVVKEAVLHHFGDMPEEGRDKINWEIDIRKNTKNMGEDLKTGEEDMSLFTTVEIDGKEYPECLEQEFSFSSYSKCSVEMTFCDEEDIDLSKLTIRIAYCEFHQPVAPDESTSMWVIENIEYDGCDEEFEMVDRGLEEFASIYNYDGDETEVE